MIAAWEGVGTLRTWLVFAALLLAGAEPARAGAPQLDQAAAAIDDGRYQDALHLVEQSAGAPASDSDRDWSSYLKARALIGLGRNEAAEAAVRARYRAKPSAYAWASVVSILTAQGRFDAAAAEILKLEEVTFGFVNRLRPRMVEEIVAALERAGPSDLRDQLVTRLVINKYTGPTAARVPDALRLRYVGLLLKQDRVEDAARQTEALEAPVQLAALLGDRTYSLLWDHPAVSALLAQDALAARVERGVQARLEQPAISASDWLEIMHALRTINRPAEAVRLGLHAINEARSELRGSGASLRLELAYAYAEMGEAWAARRTARELLREETQLDAPTQIALARLFSAAGDDEGALALATSIQEDSQSDATTAMADTVEACAAHNLGRLDRRDEVLAALAVLGKGMPEAAFGAQLCTGHTNDAVATLGVMLNDPATRSHAVLIAQLYADPLDPQSDPRDLRYRLRALAASEAVQAALKPYGRTVPLPFSSATAGAY